MKEIILNICYILFFFIFLGCSTNSSSKNESNAASSEIIDTKIENETTNKRIVVFGDSLTAGYGLEDVNDAFPGILQEKLDSLNLDFEVINSGVSGETTAGGLNRIDWILNEKPDIFILELGANDGLRGLPLSATRDNLQKIITKVNTKYPESKIILAGMQIPPNLGRDYTEEFKSIFPELALKNNIKLVPFLLENVGGVPSLNQADGIHPTAEGHKILAKNVWKILLPILK